jgi:hypothetical protein
VKAGPVRVIHDQYVYRGGLIYGKSTIRKQQSVRKNQPLSVVALSHDGYQLYRAHINATRDISADDSSAAIDTDYDIWDVLSS